MSLNIRWECLNLQLTSHVLMWLDVDRQWNILQGWKQKHQMSQDKVQLLAHLLNILMQLWMEEVQQG